jgi:membrane fusion protein (multidrug efflux system)
MPRRRLIQLGVDMAILAVTGVAAAWLADQAAFITTSDARIRARMVTLSAETAGRIVEMPISAGDRIERGQVLLQLDDRKARLALAAATLELKTVGIEIDRERLNANMSEARGRERVASRQATLEAASANLGAAKAILTRAQADHARTTALHGSGLVAQTGMDRAAGALEIARQDVIRAQADLASHRANLGEARADMQTAEISRRDADALAMSAHVLQQRIALLKTELDLHRVASPLDGTVDETFAEVGEHVAPGARIALAHASDDLWLEANIKETDLPRVRIGAVAQIRLDASQQACGGVVERIGDATTSEFALIPNANPAGVFTKITQRVPVRIRLGAECREARPGAMATLRISAQ